MRELSVALAFPRATRKDGVHDLVEALRGQMVADETAQRYLLQEVRASKGSADIVISFFTGRKVREYKAMHLVTLPQEWQLDCEIQVMFDGFHGLQVIPSVGKQWSFSDSGGPKETFLSDALGPRLIDGIEMALAQGSLSKGLAGKEEASGLRESLGSARRARRTRPKRDSATPAFRTDSHVSPTSSDAGFDVFISHASEDKAEVARPVYHALRKRGFRVWFDEAELALGDGLRRKIDEGLSRCRFGVVILSESFFRKEWPQRELDGLVAREMESSVKAILPVWHNVTQATVAEFSPPLADRLAITTNEGIDSVVEEIVKVLAT